MARLAFIPFPEEGHLYPTFELARRLQAGGHEVWYLGMPDFEGVVKERGFRFEPVLSAQFPAGFRVEQATRLIELQRSLAHRPRLATGLAFAREMSQVAYMKAIAEAMLSGSAGELHAAIDRVAPDLVLADTLLPYAALGSRGLGLRTMLVSVNISLSRGSDALVPHPLTGIVPDDSWSGRARIAASWRSFLLLRKLVPWMLGYDVDGAVRRLAAKVGFPEAELEETAFGLVPRMTQLVLCPAAFDFPRAPRRSVHFVEASVSEPSVGELQKDAGLIFCTLGSQSHLYPNAKRFFESVFDAAAARPTLRFIVAVGRFLNVAEFSPGKNVELVPWANQAEVLSRAALMVNHGGLSTVKECITHGVPMVVSPGLRDQPGYAARVVFHGLGVRISGRRVSPGSIGRSIDRVLADPSYRVRAQAMSQEFRKAQESGEAISVIEAVLASSQPGFTT